MSRLDTLRESWTAMFTHIDDVVTKVVENYPNAEPLVDRDIIELIVEEQKNKDQEELF